LFQNKLICIYIGQCQLTLRKGVKDNFQIFQYSPREGWRRTYGRIVWKRSTTQRQRGKERRKYNKRKKAKWIGHMLRGNCLLKLVVDGKIEGTRRW